MRIARLIVVAVIVIAVALVPSAAAAQWGASAAAPPAPPPQIAFGFVGRYDTGLLGSSAETVSIAGDRMYVSNADNGSIDVVDITNPAIPTLLRRVDAKALAGMGDGASVSSVVASRGVVAVAVIADPKTEPGAVLVLDASGALLGRAPVGSNPDAMAFTPDGKRILVANEGEPVDYTGTVDPEGTISIVTVPPGQRKGNSNRQAPLPVKTVHFRDFNTGGPRAAELPAGVRVFGPNATVAQDVEPEYVTVSPDGRSAYVTLQENNAMAILNLPSGGIRSIVALGYQDFGTVPFDPSDRDSGIGNNGAINIRTWPNAYGMYQPDQAAAFEVNGQTYVLTANEGDAREWPGLNEEARGKDVAAPGFTSARDNAQLGRLTVTTATPGEPSGQTSLYAFGSRSFSVWDANGAQVWDSKDLLEQLVARVYPADFNSTNDANGSFDSRSDNKGPEPEGATVGVIDGRTYGFVGLERQGGVVITDLTDPQAPVFQQYLITRQFTGSTVGPDSGPEGLSFVSRGPTGSPMLAVANEVTGTVGLFTTVKADGAGSLALLHNNDGESSLLPATVTQSGVTTTYGSVAAFKTTTDREIRSARDAGRSVVNVYAGDAFLAGATLACSNPDQPTGPVYDAIAQRRIAYDAHIFGNHEFDYTPTFLERFVRDFARPDGRLTQPFLSANLDFSGEPSWADLLAPDGLIVGEATDGNVVARSAVLIDPTTTARIGIVAATTPALATISSPRNVQVTSADIASTAPLVQDEVDRLTGLGVQKVAVVSHLQDIANDVELVGLLRDVDVAVAGGGDELLANPGDLLIPGDGASSNPVAGPYPRLVTSASGATVPLVTTNGNYKYVGRLDVAFDAAGAATVQGGGPKRVVIGSTAATQPADRVSGDPALVAEVQTPVTACLARLAATPVARTDVVFDRGRPGVRARQANAGNLVADAWLDTYARNAANVDLPALGASTVAIQNGGGIRDNAGNFLPTNGQRGVISRLDLLNMLPFDNTMVAVQGVTPTELKDILERSAASLPGQGGQFLQIAGFKVTYNTTFPAQVITNAGVVTTPGQRVREVSLNDGTPIITGGAVVAGAPNVDVVTNNFTAGGGDNYPWLAAKPKVVLRTGDGLAVPYELPVREYLESFPRDAGGLPTVPVTDPRYSPYPTGDVNPGNARITIQTS